MKKYIINPITNRKILFGGSSHKLLIKNLKNVSKYLSDILDYNKKVNLVGGKKLPFSKFKNKRKLGKVEKLGTQRESVSRQADDLKQPFPENMDAPLSTLGAGPVAALIDIAYKVVPRILNWSYNKSHCKYPMLKDPIRIGRVRRAYYNTQRILAALAEKELKERETKKENKNKNK